MMPYPMSQARRALIRRDLADRAAKAARLTRIAEVARAADRRRRLASDVTTFAHLNTPEAVAAMHAWKGMPLNDGDDDD